MSTPTLPEARPLEKVRRARTLRRVGASVLVIFVLAGALGAFGTRTGEASAEGGGYQVRVVYPTVSRPGHAIRFEVHVHRTGGFGAVLRMRLLSEYFDLFDENAFTPDPASSTTHGPYELVEFDTPPGEDFVLHVDTRVEPARQRGTSGEVSIVDGSGQPLTSVRFRTRIFP